MAGLRRRARRLLRHPRAWRPAHADGGGPGGVGARLLRRGGAPVRARACGRAQGRRGHAARRWTRGAWPWRSAPTSPPSTPTVTDDEGTVYFERNAQSADADRVHHEDHDGHRGFGCTPRLDTQVVVSGNRGLGGRVLRRSAGRRRASPWRRRLSALLVPSGNDAAVAIAETVGALMDPEGGYDAFIAAMNAKAAEARLRGHRVHQSPRARLWQVRRRPAQLRGRRSAHGAPCDEGRHVPRHRRAGRREHRRDRRGRHAGRVVELHSTDDAHRHLRRRVRHQDGPHRPRAGASFAGAGDAATAGRSTRSSSTRRPRTQRFDGRRRRCTTGSSSTRSTILLAQQPPDDDGDAAAARPGRCPWWPRWPMPAGSTRR